MQALDYIKANPQVCFAVGRQSGKVCRHPQGARCPVDTDSVICYGKARIIEDTEELWEILNRFNRHLQPDAEEIPVEAISRCYAIEIKITKMTGREYHPFTYYGPADAENIIVAMGSITETIKEVIDYLNAKGEKLGLISVHLYRPFSAKYFFKVVPKSVKRVCVLDRTKEPGVAVRETEWRR